MQKRVNLVDLVKTQQLSNEYLVFPCTIWRRYSRERASQSSPKISQKLEKNIGGGECHGGAKGHQGRARGDPDRAKRARGGAERAPGRAGRELPAPAQAVGARVNRRHPGRAGAKLKDTIS